MDENTDTRCWVYIAECIDGTYYTGISKNINNRLDQHNTGNGAVYTEKHGPVNLVYFEEYPTRSAACKRELQIKKFTHSQKKLLADSFFHS